MLQHLSIKNYALIDNLQVDFTKGLSIITGETGAGKSILLGGLALVLGKRADLSSLKDKEKKCVIEAVFSIANYSLASFFEQNDLDYEEETIIRREILPSGKSRAFINDTPINLSVLNQLSKQLIDVHSQHETMLLADGKFQFQLIDTLAKNKKYLESFKRGLKIYKNLIKELAQIRENQKSLKQQYDYNLHLFEELENANFQVEEQKDLEQNLDKLNNVESIKLNLSEAIALLQNEELGLLDKMTQINTNLHKIASFSKSYAQLSNRIESAKIELEDIALELEKENEEVDFNPLEIEKMNDRLELIYRLQKKHQVDAIADLLKIKEKLEVQLQEVTNADTIVKEKQNAIEKVSNQLNDLADKIHLNRKKAIPVFTKQLEKKLQQLEMPNVQLQIELNKQDAFLANGKDQLEFLISVNKGSDFISIKKGPSGGEMSRIMLAIKTILSNYSNLPTIIFDEIDTGVSGEVSNKIAQNMQEMSTNMQVIAITHLPQIAAKGGQHYKVFKQEKNKKVETNIKALNTQERILEIAEMLGGKNISNSALEHAKVLLKL
ncbi:MAG TPA: DNA repair protein RecN [Flavobacteriia bacterium]|nr:DNA repair protein RecN [Flavobacteriia bacterium]